MNLTFHLQNGGHIGPNLNVLLVTLKSHPRSLVLYYVLPNQGPRTLSDGNVRKATRISRNELCND